MIWRDEVRSVAGGRREESLLITKSDLAEMSESAKSLILPFGYDGGNAVKRKITAGKDGFSHLTADEWRVWIIAMSPYLLPLRLNMQYYNHWMKFVEANRYIANTSITEEEIDYVHSLLKEFLSEFMEIYHDASYLSLNMHNHLHIKEGLLDYGPAMSHWLFNFERYNGDLKVINTNNKGSVENTITKRFLESVFAGDYFDCLPRNIAFDDDKESEEDNDMYNSKFDISLFLENEASGDGKLHGYECVPASIVKNVKAKARPLRMNDEANLSNHDILCTIHCNLSNIDTVHSSNLHCTILYFFFIHYLMDSMMNSWCLLLIRLHVRKWFKKKEGLNLHAYEINNMEVWSNEFEDPSAMSIVPVMRIHSPVAIKLDHLQGINVVINLPRHLIN
ncbi:uncharacterized protein BX663DRAFT_492868 [Cokeromyces recurvatus]|uniref:uncharacterized protein n=1 Tax=Cokeromyces recurvatus TaxID=90255 RepID=UPI0022204B5E|nr:uncharacterized protein BX663DRAFT_492868 [Cokeromyces recurvatus]KAI7908068.1 hypothetical protein BX663DRAFT_492868 [Cokeromyces recurvatus]